MLIVVVVDELPFLHRVQARLEQGDVGESAAIEGIHERFWVRRGRFAIEEPAEMTISRVISAFSSETSINEV
jgi:hypothetical protein